MIEYRRVLSLVAGLLLMLTLSACSQDYHVEGGLPDRDPDLAYRLVTEEGAILLDVRTPQEFRQDGLPQARNIWVEELPRKLDQIDALAEGDKGKPIVVYCTVGGRAARAKQILLRAGYRQVSNLGGVSDWPSRH